MKRLMLVASLVVLAAACAREETQTTVDSAAPAMAPAPAVTDTTAPAAAMDSTMKHDSTAK
jgi:hypothetical protein